ncbi:hypothetical protein AVEN_113538-1 [Araneus ventricosus]|uniref:Uncharacterized protein n=1 Tax=Araneus ventricosus TaxID=182803 RepID=A0A4Y2KJW5_ARAVE|nr:hypothetical protein AVEN_113538-1 [Araneus ventricosus]
MSLSQLVALGTGWIADTFDKLQFTKTSLDNTTVADKVRKIRSATGRDGPSKNTVTSSCDKHRVAEGQAGLFDLKILYGLKKGSKKDAIDWCTSMNMTAKEYACPTCGEKMVLTERDGSDGYSWVCRKFGVNAHRVRRSMRRSRTWQMK